MKTKILSLALVLFLLAAGVTLANGGVESPRRVLSGGASDAAGGGVTLRGTLGQPVIGSIASLNGRTVVGQGFWHGEWERVYLPLIRK